MNSGKDQKEKEEASGWRKKFRVVAIEEKSFHEKWSLRTSWFNIISWALFGLILSSILTIFLFAVTPIKTMLPGFHSDVLRKVAKENDSAVAKGMVKLNQSDKYYKDLITILNGGIIEDSLGSTDSLVDPGEMGYVVSKNDSLLRKEIENEEQYNISFSQVGQEYYSKMHGVYFYTPIKGRISSSFNVKRAHYGVDIIAAEKTPILSTLDGTVINASWTIEDGYVIQVQHTQNLISSYKHNSRLLKKVGDMVKAGEPIAIIGNTGAHSTGPHLHFELWQNGVAIDPEDHILF